jgi:hypothetical protein
MKGRRWLRSPFYWAIALFYPLVGALLFNWPVGLAMLVGFLLADLTSPNDHSQPVRNDPVHPNIQSAVTNYFSATHVAGQPPSQSASEILDIIGPYITDRTPVPGREVDPNSKDVPRG